MTVGLFLIVAGVLVGLVAVIMSLARETNRKGQGGAVVIVGFIPIIFANDKQLARILLILSIVLVGAILVLFVIQGYF